MNKTISVNVIIFLLTIWSLPPCAMANDNQCVVLLHGLGRTHHSMSAIEHMLKNKGYYVVNSSYPSTKQPIKDLAAQYIPSMVNECLRENSKQIHFVTHSLGGIVLQVWLQNHKIPNSSRIIMLGPPNHGSPIAELLKNNFLFKKIIGSAGQEMIPGKLSNGLKISHKYQIGVIAGNYNLNPFGKYLFNEDNDGKVSVSSAKSDNMSDYIVLPVTHTFMMRNKVVKEQILYFLRFGKFMH